MKIRNKKQMNLPQLIEWLLNSKYSSYIAFSNMGNHVQLEKYGALSFSNGKFYPEETFTIEYEEEITEDTVLPRILVKSNYDDTAKEYRDSKINDFVPMYTRAIYILNDDLTMTLIWTHEKGMVE